MNMPLGALGTLMATHLRVRPDDVYFKFGLITIMGPSVKNTILVIEFAMEEFDRDQSRIDTALHAVRGRLRPILMTPLAFGFGGLPLVISHGAGSGGQNAIGDAIGDGAITATLLGRFYVPVKPTRPPGADAPDQEKPSSPDALPRFDRPRAETPVKQTDRELAHV